MWIKFLVLLSAFFTPAAFAECPSFPMTGRQVQRLHDLAQKTMEFYLREQAQLPAEARLAIDPLSFVYTDNFLKTCGTHFGGFFHVALTAEGKSCSRGYQVNFFSGVPYPFPEGAAVELKSDGCK